MTIENLNCVRSKLNNLLEIYAPLNIVQGTAKQALLACVVEFEACVREDERAEVAAQAANAQGQAMAAAAKNREQTVAALTAPAVIPSPDRFAALSDPLVSATPSFPGQPPVEDAGTDANGSPVPREIGDAPPVPIGEGFKDTPAGDLVAPDKIEPKAKGKQK